MKTVCRALTARRRPCFDRYISRPFRADWYEGEYLGISYREQVRRYSGHRIQRICRRTGALRAKTEQKPAHPAFCSANFRSGGMPPNCCEAAPPRRWYRQKGKHLIGCHFLGHCWINRICAPVHADVNLAKWCPRPGHYHHLLPAWPLQQTAGIP